VRRRRHDGPTNIANSSDNFYANLARLADATAAMRLTFEEAVSSEGFGVCEDQCARDIFVSSQGGKHKIVVHGAGNVSAIDEASFRTT
jgi:hypothetical protein